MRRVRVLLAVVGFSGALVVATPTAHAACHAFTVRAEPAQVAEGGNVLITVTRDSNVNPSQIEVSSVDVTATGDQDYPAQRRTVSFTAETRQSFEIPIFDDPASEGDETFELHLTNPGGCAVNRNFQVGPAAAVTIQRSDDSAPAADPPAADAPAADAPAADAPAAAPPIATAIPDPATTVPTSAVPGVPAPGTEITSSTVTAPADTGQEEASQVLSAASDDDDSSSGAGAAVAAVLAVAALGTAHYFLYRRRSPGIA